MQSKIQIPIKTKIALAIIYLVSLAVVACLIRTVSCPIIYGVDGNCGLFPFTSLILFIAYSQLGLVLFILLGIFSLFFAKNYVWGYGAIIVTFSLFNLLFFIVAGLLIDLFPILVSMVAVDFCALILLIIDRKNYFAAIGNYKK